MNGDVTLVDTNILVYAYDTHDKSKHNKCKSLIEAAFKGEKKLAVSNQILAELFFVLTTKLKKPFPDEDASAIVCGIADSINWTKINYSHETVKKAIEISKEQNTSIWDSLIAAAAIENCIRDIYTENTKDFKDIAHIKPINPMST